MSIVSSDELNLKLWNAAEAGDNAAVLAAIANGANVNHIVNLKNDRRVSNNDNYLFSNDYHDCIVDSRSHESSCISSVYCSSLI